MNSRLMKMNERAFKLNKEIRSGTLGLCHGQALVNQWYLMPEPIYSAYELGFSVGRLFSMFW